MTSTTPPPIAVCANCVHVRKNGIKSPALSGMWVCGAAARTMHRPASVDPITGRHVEAQHTGPRCEERNAGGKCQDFRSNGGLVEEPPDAAAHTDSTAVFLFYVVFVLGAAAGAACMAVWG